ncbi:PTS sugar transporter subunit IIA [Lactiplantibacillus mudanjiangensis]|uniref:PTS system, fructose-specific IIA component (Plasmid) [Lactobacillus rhamnosus Lc 705] n=1 Tax=Lactiplantibacillus mudanjiangensis TaxID=1296538 RepID=A0A660E3N7_9LACO|nr:fructose PTS transporter subunit IIA [Lactiplantibacillus mudanjiangensis]VDG20259.1 PTS system, fructose-specific IIA component (plasmid) [Lactobacillus rhamnosus Lc 705] [Lactiplantibacillus mudanjiangensis]VDG24050.1 PTS system, fructose-specific IIA component (plasmid) [Lactobacillus rhamnosus Lc 705] [Lactiplantibacillus mudanjiangensis]VDG30230.1 PTS system, fructose-specific IIA component (plasmid) [Lactobacillus rhamnosus Lc 705] [Lactiplantibacillus mudanjiangensis]VDG33852.1 PTS sy
MTVAAIVQPNLVKFNVVGQDRQAIIKQLATLYLQEGVIGDVDEYIAAVNEREQEGTTGVGGGIAIPHGKADTVTRSAVAIAKLAQPVEWQALDDQPVEYVFLLAIPNDGDNEHLKLLSELAGTLMDDDVRAKLQAATSSQDLEQIFEK